MADREVARLKEELAEACRSLREKDEELEQQPVVVDGHAPFEVVILDVQLALGPRTSCGLGAASFGHGRRRYGAIANRCSAERM